MKANQLATLILRLLGIYLLAESLPVVFTAFTPFYGAAATGEIPMAFWGLVFSIAARVIIGILLIVFSRPLGEKMAPATTGEENVSPVTFRQVQTLAFAVAGVLIFAGALPQLCAAVFNFLLSLFIGNLQNNGYALNYGRQMAESSSFGIFLKAAFGLWLFLGANGFTNFLNSREDFETPKPSQEP